jgi:hypothetical protein
MRRFQEFRGGLYRLDYDEARGEFVSVPIDFPFPGGGGQPQSTPRKPRVKIVACSTKISNRKRLPKPQK